MYGCTCLVQKVQKVGMLERAQETPVLGFADHVERLLAAFFAHL
jgi:hypothetical protein